MEKLTGIERQFATDNHNLIYKYLHEHGFCIEDYYGTAADGYLQAVMAYHRKPDLHDNYKFSTVAYKYMKREINHEFVYEKAAKRKAPEPPLNYDELEEVTLSAVFQFLEIMIQNDILGKLTERQRDIFNLKILGYENSEICELLNIPSSSLYKEVAEIRRIVKAW